MTVTAGNSPTAMTKYGSGCTCSDSRGGAAVAVGAADQYFFLV